MVLTPSMLAQSSLAFGVSVVVGEEPFEYFLHEARRAPAVDHRRGSASGAGELDSVCRMIRPGEGSHRLAAHFGYSWRSSHGGTLVGRASISKRPGGRPSIPM